MQHVCTSLPYMFPLFSAILLFNCAMESECRQAIVRVMVQTSDEAPTSPHR